MDTQERRKKWTSPEKARAAVENGKRGGRPKRLEVEVAPEGAVSAVVSGRRLGHPVDIGGGCWLFQDGETGRQWVLPVDLKKASPGRYSAGYVAKGKTPYQVAQSLLEGGARVRGRTGPLFGRMENSYGVAYYPAECHHANHADTLRAIQHHWNTVGRLKWERQGWPIEREKKMQDGMRAQTDIAERIGLALGRQWGEIVRAWVLRGRQSPHIWGEGADAWIAARLKQGREKREAAAKADPLEGFEV